MKPSFKVTSSPNEYNLGSETKDGRAQNQERLRIAWTPEEAGGYKGLLIVPRFQALIEFRQRRGICSGPFISQPKKNCQLKKKTHMT